jgi:hypothetical protein
MTNKEVYVSVGISVCILFIVLVVLDNKKSYNIPINKDDTISDITKKIKTL